MIYDIFYVSKQKVDADSWQQFRRRFPSAQKIENVKTLDDVKKKSFTKFFWLVWDDLIVTEDFAFDCDKEKCTFSFYNCIPQHPKLNRGSWKSWEATIRKESQKDILKIYAGAVYGKNKIGKGVAVPDYVWKIVYNTRTKLIIHALLFKNDASEEVQRITTSQLKQLLGYEINFNAQ